MSESDEESVVSTKKTYVSGKDIFGKYDPDKSVEDHNSTDEDEEDTETEDEEKEEDEDEVQVDEEEDDSPRKKKKV